MSTQAEFLKRLQDGLPPGKAWTRHPNAELTKLLNGCAAPLADAHNYAVDTLAKETCPGTTTALIEEWEAVVQPYVEGESPPAAIADRRAAVTRKLVQKSDSSLAGLQLIATNLGYTATFSFVTDVLRAGFSCGDRCYDLRWLNAIMVSAASINSEKDALFEAAIRQCTQAHVVVGFTWT